MNTARDLIGEWGAVFSHSHRYRYRLWRQWDDTKRAIGFCMLNPSTADEFNNDPTIERCMRRAVMMGYGRLEIVNLFGFRSTDPNGLYAETDPVGPDNIQAIVDVARTTEILVCGWGTHGKHCNMGPMIKQRLDQFFPGKAHVLAINQDGSPKHPLYVSYDVQPRVWT